MNFVEHGRAVYETTVFNELIVKDYPRVMKLLEKIVYFLKEFGVVI